MRIKDSEQIIVGTAKNTSKPGEYQFFVAHRDVTGGAKIPANQEDVGDLLVAMARKREYCKQHKCKLNLTKWEQVMA